MNRLWVDDVRPMPDRYTHWAKTAEEAMELLKTVSFEEVSLDHDLGIGCLTGYDVAKYIEESAMTTIVHCDNCGSDWVDNGINSGCSCEIIADLRSKLNWASEAHKAVWAVRRGDECGKGGDGPCGVCLKCVKRITEERQKYYDESIRLRKCLDTHKDFIQQIIEIIGLDHPSEKEVIEVISRLQRWHQNITQDQLEGAFVATSIVDAHRQALAELSPDHPLLKDELPSFGVWESQRRKIEELRAELAVLKATR